MITYIFHSTVTTWTTDVTKVEDKENSDLITELKITNTNIHNYLGWYADNTELGWLHSV
jgi:hypothetical protein